jgi:TrmH family RNA methyltransferase
LAQLDCDVFVVTESIYKSLSQLTHATALISIIPIPTASRQWQAHQDALILDQIQDPGNVGTLLRSAAAVGIKQVISTSGTASLWSPRVLRAAMGAHFSLHLIEHVDYAAITQGFDTPILATSSHRSESIYQLDLTGPLVWVLGNEGQGVDPLLLEQAQAVSIPQPGGQESLNVAIAGSVCMFEMLRQRLN